MSVINQMLNDLEKRKAGESGLEQHPYSAPVASTGISKNVFIVALVVIGLLVGAVGYLLLERNSDAQIIEKPKLVKPAVASQSQSSEKNQSALADTAQDESRLSDNKITTSRNGLTATKTAFEEQETVEKPIEHKSAVAEPLQAETQNVAPANTLSDQAQNVPIEDASVASDVPSGEQEVPPQEIVNSVVKREAEPESKPKLSIKRAKLSPEEVAAIKVSDAKKATNRGELDKAAKLLEQALVLQPNHIEAREQLSALWYAKKDYQGAVNLLKQGIMYVPEYGEFRLLLARIFVELERYAQALATLEQKPDYADADYQSLRASLAQQLGAHDSAMSAYRYLIKHQEEQGRWWLGLAIAADQQGKSEVALQAYSQAIARGNISSQSLSFAKKRITQLGE